jgi:hypothetical protein
VIERIVAKARVTLACVHQGSSTPTLVPLDRDLDLVQLRHILLAASGAALLAAQQIDPSINLPTQ